jgi:osmotically-inducible protein OsmY
MNVRPIAVAFNTRVQDMRSAALHRFRKRRKDMFVKEQTGYTSNDLYVERDVRDALGTLGLSHLGFVGIYVDQGVVQLTGFTESYSQKWLIERAVCRVIGVRDVRDYLEVRPVESGQRADAHIALAARCALQWDARVPAGLGVEVTDGALRLFGVVEQFAQREAAEDAVRNLVGVRDLSNEIKISPSLQSTDVAGEVESALRRRFGVACRNVWIIERDGVVTASGTVATLELLTEVERVVQSVPGVLRFDNRLLVL